MGQKGGWIPALCLLVVSCGSDSLQASDAPIPDAAVPDAGPLADGGAQCNLSFSYTGMAGQPVPANFGNDLLADVDVTLNGTSAGTFTVDTGAPITILNSLVFTDRSAGRYNDDIGAFGLVFPDYLNVAFPIAGGNGLLGGDLLRHFAFTLDYEGDRVILFDPFDPSKLPADIAAGAASDVPFQLLGGGVGSAAGCVGSRCTVCFPATRIITHAIVENQSKPLTVLVDSGASITVMTEDVFLGLGDAEHRPVLRGLNLGGIAGPIDADFTRVYRLTLGTGAAAASVEDLEVAVLLDDSLLASLSGEVGQPISMLVGASYLRHFLSTVDYPQTSLRLAPYTHPQRINPNAFVGVGFLIGKLGPEWVVVQSFPDHDAFNKGVLVGDVIDEIDGTPITGQAASVVQMLLDRFQTVGEEMPIMKHSGSQAPVSLSILVEDLLPHYPPPPGK